MAIFLIFSIVFSSLLFADIESEWIVIQNPSQRGHWLSTTSQLKVHKVFGPNREFSLIRSEQPPDIESSLAIVQPNFLYRTLGDPDFEFSWGLENGGKDIGAMGAWEITEGSREVVVAIIDSGMDYTHEDLQSNLWVNRLEVAQNGIDDDGNGYVDDIFGWSFVDQSGAIEKQSEHGTFIAGIIGADADNGLGSRGVTRSVSLLPVKFLDKYGYGTTAMAIEAIEYAVNQGAKIINASWGGGAYDPALYRTIEWAAEKGVLVVAASGNSADNNDTSKKPIYPASFDLPNVVSVAAYDKEDERWEKSNYGSHTVDMGAPGVSIYSTIPGGYRYGSGTSYAAPFVAGVAALLLSIEPHLPVVRLRERLLSTSQPLHYYEQFHTATGGRVQAENALKAFRPPRQRPPENWETVSVIYETPHPYEPGANIEQTIRYSGAKHIRLHFKKMDIESCCDSVTLLDGNGKTVFTYTGNYEDYWSVDALGDTIVLKFESDFVINKYGYHIDAIGVSY